MNFAFVALGLLMAAGAPLIHQEFRERRLAVLGFCGMAIAGLGTVFVGVFPENVNNTLHVIGAAGPFLVGNVALIILSCTLTMSMRVRVSAGSPAASVWLASCSSPWGSISASVRAGWSGSLHIRRRSG